MYICIYILIFHLLCLLHTTQYDGPIVYASLFIAEFLEILKNSVDIYCTQRTISLARNDKQICFIAIIMH